MRSAKLCRVLWTSVCGVALLSSAGAHHSTAMYDYAKTVTLTATVRQFQWTNPHCFVQVLAPDAQGNEVEWAIETGTPVISARKGWNKNSLKPGDKVSVVISPLRDGTPGGTLRTVTLADGKELEQGMREAQSRYKNYVPPRRLGGLFPNAAGDRVLPADVGHRECRALALLPQTRQRFVDRRMIGALMTSKRRAESRRRLFVFFVP